MNPAVTVIIPNFNYADFIEETLRSVLNQTFQDFEAIVIDDGSTDQSLQVIKKIRDEFRGKLILIEQENKGVYAARNRAIKIARGRYISFLDADDIWEPETLEGLVTYLEANPNCMMAYANASFFYNDTRRELGHNIGPGSKKTPHTGRCADKLFLEGNFIPFMTTILRRQAFEQVGFFNETLKVGGDYDMFMRIACLYPIGYVDRLLCRVRRHNRNLSFKLLLQAVTQIRILKKALKFFSDHQFRIDEMAVRKRWAQIYYELGTALVLNAEPKRARLALRKSLSMNPSFFSNKIVFYMFLSFFLPLAGGLKSLRTYWHVMREKLRIRNR